MYAVRVGTLRGQVKMSDPSGSQLQAAIAAWCGRWKPTLNSLEEHQLCVTAELSFWVLLSGIKLRTSHMLGKCSSLSYTMIALFSSYGGKIYIIWSLPFFIILSCNSVALTTHVVLCNPHYHLVPKPSHYHVNQKLCHQAVTAHPLPLYPSTF